MAPSPVKIRWTTQAADDLESMHEFVSESSLLSANAIVDRILADIDNLERFPQLGRTGRIDGTRELVIPRTPFIVVYRLVSGQVEIVGVLHGSRKWPKNL